MRLKPTTWMVISFLLFAASAWMWHIGQHVASEPQSSSNQTAAATARNRAPATAATTNSAAKATAVKVVAKSADSYILRNTAQTLKQLERNDRAVILRNALIDTTRNTKLAIPAQLRSDSAPGAYIVQSPRPLNAAFYAELNKDGAEYVSYIPNDAALVKASPATAQMLTTDPAFAAVMPYEPYYKLDASLLPEAVNQTLMTNNTLRVTVFPGQTDAAVQSLNAMGAHVFGEDPGPFGTTLVALVPPDKLVAVAQMPQAQEIEAYSHRHLLNDIVRTRLGVAATQTTPINYLGLTGSNIWLALNDTGVDNTHPDLANRLAFNTPDYAILSTDTNGHGTHVAGIIAGNGAESTTVTNNIPGSGVPVAGQFRGMAPQASLAVTAVDTITGPFFSDSYLQTVPYIFLSATNAGSTTGVTNGFISNNSWSYADTAYDSMAASYDAAARHAVPNSPGESAMLFVFAAGDNFQVPDSITSPGTAKNGITVGATQNPRDITNLVSTPFPLGSTNLETNSYWMGDTDGSNQVAALTSAGNVDVGTEGPSGRFKPDLVTPGVFVISDRSANYQDPSLLQTIIINEWPGPTTGPAITPGQTNIYAITIPANTTNLIIQAAANPQSPVPFPTDLQFFLNTTNTFPAGTQIVTTNEAGLPMVVNPPATNCYIGVYEPAADAQPVGYDLSAWITTNAQFGTYFSTLSNLNNAFADGANKYYRYESGTSMSAASVSGLAADMQQFLISYLHIMPSPALIKALLINGARPLNNSSDLSPAQPENVEGWGLPNLSNSIPANLTNSPASSMVFYDQSATNSLQTGQWHNYIVTLLDTNATNFPLRFTLVWTDPPGNPAAGIALVNNLDLMVADNTGTNLYIGNDFPLGGGEAGVFTQPSPTNTADSSDLVNNVENVFIDSAAGLTTTTFYVSVRGTRVPVNAVTTQTNAILQDFALVISSDDQATTTGLTVQDLGTTNAPLANFAIVSSWTNTNAITLQPVTAISSGVPLLHQRVGANEPNLWTPVFGGTNGNPLQWHFFVMTNTVTATNTNLNLAVFTTFLPPSLTFNSDPDNMSLPANGNADIDLYVSTDSSLTNLNATAVADSFKSLGRGGNETVFFTNATSNQVFYAGVKSETQQGADFGFFAEITSNGPPANGNNPVTGYGNVPVAIPDEAPGGQGAFVFAPIESAATVRKVTVEVGLEHPNPADLLGTLMSPGDQQATINNYTASEWAGFTNFYDDLPDGSVTNPVPTDFPGTLKNFVGQQATGMWILNETDNALLQTGMVTTLQVTVYPQPQNPLNFLTTIPANGWYYGYVDLPDDTTNVSIAVGFSSGGPVGIYITNQDAVNIGDYGVAPIPPPGGQLDVPNIASNIPAGATVNPPSPAIAGGRWFYGIFNNSFAPLTVHVVITISESQTPNLTLTEVNNTPTSLQTDAHTQSQICIDDGIFTNNQALVSLQVGVRLDDPNLDDLVLHLVSPQGTSVTLFENRGGTVAGGLGLTVTNAGSTNGSYDYTVFSEDTNIATSLIKFAIPPYAQPTTNTTLYSTSFETNALGDYGPTNQLFPVTLGTNLGIWTVTSNNVAVIGGNSVYSAYDGTNYLALANGQLTQTIPTVVGQPYSMTYAYRGPGLVDWWPFDEDATPASGVGMLLNIAFTSNPTTPEVGYAATGVTSADYWNAFSNDEDGRSAGTLLNLKTSTGTATQVGISVTNIGGAYGNGACDPMYQAYLYNVSGGNTIPIYVTNLQSGTYNLYLYGHGNQINQSSVFTVSSGTVNYGTNATASTGTGWESSTWQLGQQYVVFTNVLVTNNQPLVITVLTDPGGYELIGGIQIAQQVSAQSTQDLIGRNAGIATNLQIVPGEVGLGVQFDGTNSQINFGADAGNVGTNNFTIDWWMNTTNLAPIQAFLAKRANCNVTSLMDVTIGGGAPVGIGRIQVQLSDGVNTSALLYTTNALNDGQWHHVAWERQANPGGTTATEKIYVDGQLNNTSSDPEVLSVINSSPLIMGLEVSAGGNPSVPYTGAADELDIWNRALTDVEIAALYEAGTNHIGKATPVSVLPNADFLVNGVTNSTIIASASGTNWLTNIVYFTALSNTTTIVLQGNPLGMLFDNFQEIGLTNFNYVLPEQSLGSLTGENPLGCWTLDVWDTRTDSPLPTNGTLLSWNLQMTVSATNVNLIVLTNHIAYTNGLVQGNNIEYFAFDVPITANFVTNTLTNASANLTVLFNQTALPTGTDLGDYALIANTNYGVYTLTNNAPPPGLVPGQRYYLGVLNTNPVPATFTLRADTDNNALVVTPLTNGIALTTNIMVSTNAVSFNANPYATNSPQYYSFTVPTNAILASFEIINPTDQIGLYVRHASPLPSSTSYDYAADYDGTNDEAIVVTDDSYALNGAEETTNSTPVPLTGGTWYVAVYDYSPTSTTNAVTYTIEATYVTNSVVAGVTNYGINIIPLTNQVADGTYSTNGTSSAGPALTNFYAFTVTNAAPGVQFAVTGMNENVDLIVRDGFLPTPQQMTAGSFNPGTNTETITLVTNASMPSLNGIWYLGVPDNGSTNVTATYLISAVTLTNINNIFTSPAVVFLAAVITTPTNGFTMNWIAVPSAEYEVDMTTDFNTWTYVSTVTTMTPSGSYTDSTPINSQTARFFRVFRIH